MHLHDYRAEQDQIVAELRQSSPSQTRHPADPSYVRHHDRRIHINGHWERIGDIVASVYAGNRILADLRVGEPVPTATE